MIPWFGECNGNLTHSGFEVCCIGGIDGLHGKEYWLYVIFRWWSWSVIVVDGINMDSISWDSIGIGRMD